MEMKMDIEVEVHTPAGVRTFTSREDAEAYSQPLPEAVIIEKGDPFFWGNLFQGTFGPAYQLGY